MARTADRTRRLYGGVDGRRRFLLAVELAARGQLAESEGLVLGARRVDCSHLDPEMSEAFEELRSMMREFDAATRRLFGSLLAIDVLRDSLVAYARSGPIAPVEPLAVVLPEALEGLAGVVEQRLHAYKQAFEELCAERLGIDPATLWAVQPGWVMTQFGKRAERIEASSPEPEEVAEAKADLLSGWGPEGLGAVLKPGEMR